MSDAAAKAPELAAILRERAAEILAAWIVRYERSELRFRRQAKAATHTAQVASLVETLTEAAHRPPGDAPRVPVRPGSEATRELERNAAFLGAQFASEGATGYDVAAVLLELRDVVASMAGAADQQELTQLFEWLTVVALDGFAAAGLQSLREQTSEHLEEGTPIVEVLPKVPAILLVGAPSASVLDNLLARAWMLAVGTGAPCLIIDCGGLAAAGEKNFERGYRAFLAQASGSALQIVLSGARKPVRDLASTLAGERGLSFAYFERFDSAVAHAIERTGQRIVRPAG